MAWTTPKTWVVGEILTAVNMNTHVRDNLTFLGTHTHTGVAGDGSSSLGPLVLEDFTDAAAPAAPGAGKTRLYSVSGKPRTRAGAAGADTGIMLVGDAPTAHEASHKTGGSDAFLSTDILEAIVKRWQESGGTTLTAGAIADGEYLKRSGTSLVSGVPSITEYGGKLLGRVAYNQVYASTSSTSFVDIDTTNLVITATTGAHAVLLLLLGSLWTSAGTPTANFDLAVDGTRLGGTTSGLMMITHPGGYVGVSIGAVTATLTAASHTFRPQWETNGTVFRWYGTDPLSLFMAIELV